MAAHHNGMGGTALGCAEKVEALHPLAIDPVTENVTDRRVSGKAQLLLDLAGLSFITGSARGAAAVIVVGSILKSLQVIRPAPGL